MTPPSVQSESESTLIVPVSEMDAQIVEVSEGPVGNGEGGSQRTLQEPADSELRKLDEEQLKAALKSVVKTHECAAKKDIQPMAYWLREKLRAQGSRNDLRDREEGLGAWVEENLHYTRRTFDRWADEYGIAHGLMKRKSTSRHMSKGFEAHPDDAFHEEELRKQGKQIHFTYWVNQKVHKKYHQSLKTIKTFFKVSNESEAVVKGVSYAAEIIAARSRAGNRKNRR